MSNNNTNATVLADSINVRGQRLVTFLLPRFPRPLLSELNTHRMFSRNAASSRAIPLEKMIAAIRADPYLPDWTLKGKGMGGERLEDPSTRRALDELALHHLEDAIKTARDMHFLGAAKENANRFLEPFARVPVIVSSTTWQNFFDLRTHEGAQADFRETALEMRSRLAESVPKPLGEDGWHLPFSEGMDGSDALIHSVACCARCSYANFDGDTDREKDRMLFTKLKEAGHWSPLEHQATPREGWHANYHGWQSLRNDLGA